MSSQWVNKFAIMRDLSLAQGCLPVDVEGVEAGDRPPSPSLNFREDTGEEFYHQFVGGDGDFSAPDLGLIKHMLEEVRSHDSPSNEDDDSGVIQIRKLDPLCPEFKPRVLNSGDDAVKNPKEPKKKKQRNIAVESLLQNIKENSTKEKQTFKLLKPTDFSTESNVESKKVFGWLQTQPDKIPSRKNVPMLDINPMSMFKKKTATETTAVPVQGVKKTSTFNYNKYVPSKNAEEYYKKFLECSEMQRIVDENVWTKVERKMKDIDERRKAEAELFSLSLALSKEQSEGESGAREQRDPKAQKLDLVSLPQHRHLLASPCAVCAHRTRRQADNQSHTIDKHEDSADDPWWNWRDAADKHGDNWRVRNETVADYTENSDETAVADHSDSDNETAVAVNTDSDNETAVAGNTASYNENADPDNSVYNNETAIADNTVNNNKTVEEKEEMKKHEDLEWWMSPLDDADEIDAWRFEILGDVDDDDDNIECQNVNETPQSLEDTETSWQNENHIQVVCNTLEKWRPLLLGRKEDNILNKVTEHTCSVNEIDNKTESPNVLPQISKCNEEMKDMKLETENKKDHYSSFQIDDQIKIWLQCKTRRQ